MKTFLEFISEAEVAWNTGTLRGSKKSPSATASQKVTQLGRQMTNPRTTPQQMASIAQRVKKMKSAIVGSGEVAKASDPRPENKDAGRTNTKVRGYASKPKDVVSRVGTTSDVQRTDLPAEPDVVTQHRYAKKGTAGGRGTNISRTGRTYGTRG
jgi:hypothetical protein